MLKYDKDKDEWVDCEDEETCNKNEWYVVNPMLKDGQVVHARQVIHDSSTADDSTDPDGSRTAYIARLERKAPQKGQQHKDAAPIVKEGREGYISRLTRSAWND